VTGGPEAQALADGSSAVFARVAGSASAPLEAAEPPAPVTVTDTPQGQVLENGLVRVEIDRDGLLASVRDLTADREVLAPGERGNLLQLHTDLPNHWDAWDIDRHYRRRHTDLTEADEVTVLDRGPLVASVRVVRSFGESRISQTISVTAGGPGVRIDTEIDWHERERILKAAFPLDVHADRTAAEIQFGHVFRPTHTNTSWDSARFETSGHRWIHLAEAGYGIALANDATYGHDVTRTTREDGGTTTTARYSLVRAPRSPDPEADQGRHRMSHTLLPGATVADAVAGGYALNLPLRVAAGSGPAGAPLVSVEGDAASIEAIKLADDRSGDVVVRLYESLGGRARTRLRAAFPIAGAEVTDLLERPLEDETVEVAADGTVPVELRPFQVLTLRLRASG
jgi:alpha-mannosidase